MTSSNDRLRPVSVATFMESGGKELEMELIAAERGLKRRIRESAINRTGLGLTGFFEYFPHRRLQVLGLAECSYLASLTAEQRRERLSDVFGKKIPCLVITRGRRPLPDLLELAEQQGVPVLRSNLITKNFITSATIILENLMAPREKVQGTMVEIMGIGVLLEGRPGLGKSEIALSLIKRGHALVADDITELRMDSAGNAIASPVDVTRYHMEIHGLGIIHVPSLFGVASVRGEKKLEMVVSLVESDADVPVPGLDETEPWSVFGLSIPRVVIPVAVGRELSNVIETAALNLKLRTLGHDAEKELDAQIIARMSKWKAGSE